MSGNPRRTRVIVVSVLLVLAMATGTSVWLVRQGGEEPATTGTVTAPTIAPGTTTPQPLRNVMTVNVYFHDRLQTDPRQVVAVPRTVPRSPRVATVTLAELLRGPSGREQEAGYWSFFSAGTAGKLRSLRIAAGLATADFADFRRAMPNTTTSYGSAALLAELDTTLRQFPTVRRTLYAFNGDVAAFYQWLQLAPPTTGRWRPIAAAPISGRDGAAAVWTGRQLLVWGGHGRVPGQGLRPLRDGAGYDPAADRWQRTPDAPAGVQGTATVAAWSGSRLPVWMGNAPDGPAVGAAYDPAKDRTGGAQYDPVRDRWTPIARDPVLGGLLSGPVWTGSQMVAWDGGAHNRGLSPRHCRATHRPVRAGIDRVLGTAGGLAR